MGQPIYLKAEKTLHQPLDKVWQTVAVGFGNVAHYNPAIKASKFDSELKSGVGTKRHCDFEPKGYIKEVITEWKEKEYFALEFTESSVPMGYMRSKFLFRESNGSTHITQEFWYRMKGPMGWLSGLMKGKMNKTLVMGMDGLEKHLASKSS